MLRLAKTIFGGVLVLVLGGFLTASLMDAKTDIVPELGGGVALVASDEPQINQQYVKYEALSDEEKAKVDLIPEEYILVVDELPDYKSSFSGRRLEQDPGKLLGDVPAQFTLANVGGRSYLTPMKDQQDTSICWAFASTEVVESFMMTKNDTPFSGNTVVLSPRQMDYAISKDGINDYTNTDNGYHELAGGGNFFMSSLAMANGITLTSENDFPFNSRMDKKDLAEVLNYSNSQYEVNETIMLPTVTSQSVFVEAVKYFMTDNGGAFVGTGSPQGSCAARNTDGTIIIAEDTACRNNDDEVYGYGSHAMQIVGWNDNYSYSYCEDGDIHRSVRDGGCASGEKKTGTGAWIVRNSWGDDATYKYVYLSYSSLAVTIDFITDVTEMSDRTWDNNYHDNMYNSNSYSQSRSVSASFTKKISGVEKVEKVKFMSLTTSGKYTVSVNGHNAIVTEEKDWPGIHTIDLSSYDILVDGDLLTVSVTGETGDLVVGKTISVFTSNVSTDPIIDLKDIDGGTDTLESGDFRTLAYSNTKNVPSGTEVTYTLSRDGEDYSNYLSVSGNKVAINNINTWVTIDNEADYGDYILTAHYGDYEASAKVSLKSSLVLGFDDDVASKKDGGIVFVNGAGFEALTQNANTTATSPEYLHYDKDMNLVDRDLLVTGDTMVAKLSDKTTYKYLISVYGDINSDGVIGSGDYIKIRKHIMGSETIGPGILFYAADVTNDNQITSGDYIKIRKIIMDKGSL